jgi:predicted phage tail protein
MPMILNGRLNRLAFRFGRVSALRQTGETVDQLQAQIERLKEQMRFNAAEYEKQIAVLIRDLMAAHYELARRDLVDAYASAPSPSAMVH